MSGSLNGLRSRKSLAGGAILGVIAWGLLAVQVARLLSVPSDLLSMVISLAVPLMLSVTLFIGGVGMVVYDLDDLALRISGWTVLGLVLFAGVLGGELAYLQPRFSGSLQLSILVVNVAAGGAVLGFVIGLYDARQRLLLADLRAEYDRTLGLSQRLSVLARILRHDLRNHLNVILGQADAVESDAMDPEIVRAMAAIRKSGRELGTISDTIGRFSAILENPRPEQTTRRVDLAGITRNAIETVQERHAPPPGTFEVSTPESAVVEASPFLPQAVTELVENALVHNTAQTPWISVLVTPIETAGGGFELHITDNGPGIPTDEVAIHDRATETQLNHSLGVGLWLVRWVVTASGGDLVFDTESQAGTSVRIRFVD